MPLQCNWESGFDLDGLNEQDKRRIKQVGVSAWIKEIQTKKTGPVPVKTGSTPVKSGSLGDKLARDFLAIASKNKDIVTYEQCKELCPAYPTDPPSWARAKGARIRTEKKNRRYVVEAYA